MPRTAWVFTDPSAGIAAYSLAVNPLDVSKPRRKSVIEQATTGADGKLVLQEGRDQPEIMTISGTLLEQAQHDAFNTWFDLRRQIEVTDDLGVTRDVYIDELSMERVRSVTFPWRHRFTMRLRVL